jgi:hypothetical protein
MSKKIPTHPGRPALSKPGRQLLYLIILPALVVVLGVAMLPASAQRATPATGANSAASRNAALREATNEVLKETSEIRQLAVLRPVLSSAQSRAEIERMIVANLDRETTPGRLHATEVTLKRLGLVPSDFQFRDLMVRLLTEQVAGYYEPKTQQFHLADWIDVDGQRPIMAHELTHALQDQHFNLRRFERWPRGDSDAEMAAHALIEGDATLAMSHYVARSPMRALALFKSLGTTGMASQELDKAPRVVRESLLFPYQEGLAWTNTLYRYGGWDRISQAFTTLPQSTEQIIHPDKYFVHEAPVKISLRDLTAMLNGRGRANVWKKIDSDVNGEFGFYLILDQFLKSQAESEQASAGWGGDSYAVYESRTGEVVLISLSQWDREKDASEFFDAYVKRTELRLGEMKGVKAGAGTRTPTSVSWKTPEGRITVELRSKRVLISEGLPDRLNVTNITSWLWSE